VKGREREMALRAGRSVGEEKVKMSQLKIYESYKKSIADRVHLSLWIASDKILK
jgi:hypothetical protein